MNVLAHPTGDRILTGDALAKLDDVPDNKFRLIVTSPPYNINKSYERNEKRSLSEYIAFLDALVEKLDDKVTEDGSLCWQTGNYVKDGEVFPLDIFTYDLFAKRGYKLRNRIIWQFNFGLHSTRRLSGRYETILWFTKGDEYIFNIDPIRVPQTYPGKRHSKARAAKAGTPSGNPAGKNPSDYWIFDAKDAFDGSGVWKIPNLKANHVEKTEHPCQFPLELAERCILAFSKAGDWVLDPFAGVGTTLVAAAKLGRTGVGIDSSHEYVAIAKNRLRQLAEGTLPYRPLGTPPITPPLNHKVASIPREWLKADDEA